jgi:hypothetical protein
LPANKSVTGILYVSAAINAAELPATPDPTTNNRSFFFGLWRSFSLVFVAVVVAVVVVLKCRCNFALIIVGLLVVVVQVEVQDDEKVVDDISFLLVAESITLELRSLIVVFIIFINKRYRICKMYDETRLIKHQNY